MKILKYSLIILGSIILILGTTLVIHIAMVSGQSYDNSSIQMTRFDFQQELNPELVKTASISLRELDGYQNHRFSPNKDFVVVMYSNQNHNSTDIANKLNSQLPTSTTIYKPNMESTGCPVIDKNSISYRVSSGIKKLLE